MTGPSTRERYKWSPPSYSNRDSAWCSRNQNLGVHNQWSVSWQQLAWSQSLLAQHLDHGSRLWNGRICHNMPRPKYKLAAFMSIIWEATLTFTATGFSPTTVWNPSDFIALMSASNPWSGGGPFENRLGRGWGKLFLPMRGDVNPRDPKIQGVKIKGFIIQ